MRRHKWVKTTVEEAPVLRCAHCGTETKPDDSTKSLWLYRRGRAMTPRGRPLSEEWVGFKAGVTPVCVERQRPPL